MTAQPISPTVATPRADLKRKHNEIVNPSVDGDAKGRNHVEVDGDGSEIEANKQRRMDEGKSSKDDVADEEEEEEGDDGDDPTFYEDALDEIEDFPYTAGACDRDLSQADAAGLRARLRRIGPQAFIGETLDGAVPRYSPRVLGTAFGMHPEMLEEDDDTFARLLVLAIVRAFNKRLKLPQYNTVDDAADLLRRSQNIMVITGAGISTSLGIPDFRSTGTGFYDKVRQLGYSEGEEVFQIDNFDDNPSIFYSLAGDILPQGDRCSPTHAFVRLLQDKGRLQTNYTQNIDNVEDLAGIDRARLIQCHGSFARATCRKCKTKVDGHEIFHDIRAKRVSRCRKCIDDIAKLPAPPNLRKSSKPKRSDWEDSDESDGEYDIPKPGVMKPDITFFGEQLPNTFFTRFTEHDSKQVDLVLVIGTSLKVAPVSEMPNYLPHEVPHVYISRESIEHVNFDIQLIGECDHVVFELCRRAGWELKHEMIPKGFKVQVQPADDSAYRWFVRPAAEDESVRLRDQGLDVVSVA